MIKDVLDNLQDDQRRQLFYAFDHEFAQHVVLPDNKFVGVNVVDPHLVAEESAGVWTYGTIKGGTE